MAQIFSFRWFDDRLSLTKMFSWKKQPISASMKSLITSAFPQCRNYHMLYSWQWEQSFAYHYMRLHICSLYICLMNRRNKLLLSLYYIILDLANEIQFWIFIKLKRVHKVPYCFLVIGHTLLFFKQPISCTVQIKLESNIVTHYWQ